ncbi:MAG TPA: hypothetical protein VIK59_03360 [Verrucomicrobiae bacterium]
MARNLKSIIPFVGILAMLCVQLLRAKDFSNDRVGEVAAENITAPVALDVIDPAATATLKAAEALKSPTIFRSDLGVTNALAAEFLSAFASAHTNFLAAIQDTFHQTTLNDQTIASPDFEYLVTAFDIKNKNFPITTDLAATWARGDPGLTAQKRLLDLLLLTMQHAIRPDELPENFIIGPAVSLVAINNPKDELTLNEVESRGQFLARSNLFTISNVREIFRHEFTTDEEQPLARGLTALLKPNCFPDAELTQRARDQAVRQLVVSQHYDAGQLMVRRGDPIDAKTKNVLEQLNEKLDGAQNLKLPSEIADKVSIKNPQKLLVAVLASATEIQPGPMQTEKIFAQKPLRKVSARIYWLIAALVVDLIFILFVLRRFNLRRQNNSLSPVRAANLPRPNAATLSAEIAPHLAQVVRDALVQELAVQRRELLVAQQMAAAEISQLVHRLDRLQMTMQERLQAYELQIQRLEQELAVRTEENRELLKLKIEMIREQLEAERTRGRVDFN